MRTVVSVVKALLCLAASFSPLEAQDHAASRGDPEVRAKIEEALRKFFAAERPEGAPLQEVVALAKDREDVLTDVLRTKSFVAPAVSVFRRGVIDDRGRFQDRAEVGTESRPPPPPGRHDANNAALFFGPGTPHQLAPLVVFVPDTTTTAGWVSSLEREAKSGRFVFLVPDEKQDNRWNPTQEERLRHVGPLRDFLLTYAIDPDRVFLVGTGRGGHATWDVGLTYADRWAGIVPCNGGLIHEGGYKASGGVFLENARSLVVRTVYNTTFDHGIEGCRYAAEKFKEWGYQFEAVEEPKFRHMDIPEALERLGPAARDAHPAEIVKRFNHLDAGEHFWLRALDRVPHEWNPSAKITIHGKLPDDPLRRREAIWEQVKKECAWFKATNRGNVIDVTVVRGVGKLRVWFDPELVDFGAPVRVKINGKLRSSLVLDRRVEAMLQHVHETGDTSRLYWSFHDFAVSE